MRVVVDTNVLVSAVLKETSVPALAVGLLARRAVILKSAATEQQLWDVLARPYLSRLIATRALEVLRGLLDGAELVQITQAVAACRDPTDDKFLELALDGGADFIVSGDADLLVLDPFRGIPILAPAAMLAALA